MGYISDYLHYADCDEAPSMFHLWSAYSTISAAIGRRVWLPRPPSVIYANLYVLFVGDAGCGKSQAMYKAKRVLAQSGDIRISHSVETPEGILRYLCGDPTAKPPIISECLEPMTWPDGVIRSTHSLLIMANEFIDFIRTNPEGWTGFLNNVYDEDNYTYRTKNQGTDVLPGPYICLLGAIPTDVSRELQEVNIINTGFARRTIMQYGRRRFEDPKPRPSMSESQRAAEQRCVERLRAIRKFKGELKESPEAFEYYNEWYVNHSRGLLKRSTPATLGWLSSKPTQVIKLAILTCLSESDDLVITPVHYEISLAYLAEMEQTIMMIFGGVGRNELASIAIKVLEHLQNIGEPVAKTALATRFHSSLAAGKGAQELDEILAHLKLTEQIVEEWVKVTSPAGEIQAALYATPKIMKAWKAGLNVQQPGAGQIGSLSGSAGASGPSSSQAPGHHETDPTTQDSAPSADETEDE